MSCVMNQIYFEFCKHCHLALLFKAGKLDQNQSFDSLDNAAPDSFSEQSEDECELVLVSDFLFEHSYCKNPSDVAISAEKPTPVEAAIEIVSTCDSNDAKKEKSLKEFWDFVLKVKEDLDGEGNYKQIDKIKKVIEKEYHLIKHGDTLQFELPADSNVNKHKRKLDQQKRFHSIKRKSLAVLNQFSNPTTSERDEIRSKLLK